MDDVGSFSADALVAVPRDTPRDRTSLSAAARRILAPALARILNVAESNVDLHMDCDVHGTGTGPSDPSMWPTRIITESNVTFYNVADFVSGLCVEPAPPPPPGPRRPGYG